MSTLALVPESELKKCLHMQDDRGFAPGQWVQIRRGLYQGDMGLVHESYHDNDSTRSVKVLVVPRLGLAASKKHYAPSSKRKRDAPCPPSELFQPAKCKHDLHKWRNRYTYKSWTFEYGLLVKVFNLSSVSPAREIPISLFQLFSESSKRAGNDLFEIATMPLPLFWHFDPGENVIVHYKEGATYGTVLTLEEEGDAEKTWCVVDVVGKGHRHVMVCYLEKNVIPGDFVGVLRGAYTGKSGFVVAKIDAHFGICIGAYTSGIDFRVHANSVKLTTPWLNVEVKLLIQPHAGQTGWVKDVFVDSNRSLQLVVYLCTGKTCTVGHSEVLERWTGKLLLDHQSLKPHQSQFDVDVPWKDIEVVIQSGSFVSSIGIVKDVRRDFRGTLCVLLWIVQHNCLVEVDHSAVMERRCSTTPSLPTHPIDWWKVDYNAVRYHKTKHLLCDVFMPTAKQSFYIPNTVYDQQLPDVLESVPFDASTPLPIASTPMPNDFERETIFTGIWAPDYVYPDPLESPLSPDPIRPFKTPPSPDHGPASPPLLLCLNNPCGIGYYIRSFSKGGIFVKTINSVNGISMVCQRLGQTISIPHTSIVSFRNCPKPATENGLMVVARGCPEYIGMFVPQIHHFYENEKAEEHHMLQVVSVDRSGSLERTTLNFLDVHPMDLEYVQETAEERKHSKVMLQDMRLEMQYSDARIPVRPRQKGLY
ncbi:hypothetical protein BT96DRAFT_992148 [Gymnopus androsaceus JB14]|uniref:Chromatin elongation factor spt5 n=1 Tax=Gymnopus androsaceus JB14 TaxID=1447944 RepID=A0A6A4HW01_9AGAR|nr:hypothetical protein BT96DRAFT_992148 [Gymnopus androsaceus JB14]